MGRLLLAMRENRRPLAIWALVSGVAALAGPFGTFEALGLAGRVAYWGAVAGLSVALALAFRAAVPPGWRRGWVCAGVVDLCYALVLAAFVMAINRVVFPGWPVSGLAAYLWLTGVVFAVSCVITGVIWVLRDDPAPIAAPAPAEEGGATFLRRLPVQVRGPLVRIEAQDHYLLVVTEAGREMMRMADAEAALPGAIGLRVHRSHWVAHRAVRAQGRVAGRPVLTLADGAQVPVGRSYVAAVRAAGLV